MIETSTAYKRYRFPARLIAHAVWLYFRFPLSLRLVEELLLERGIVVSYETIRRWAAKFGPAIARGVRRRAPRPGDVWHLDEVRVVIRGKVHWLWRAVDQHGAVLDEILQRHRDKRAAKRLLIKLLKRQGWVPRRIVTDKLASYGAAKREVAPGIEHRSHKGLNNRAENSHLPLRKRERQMQGFRSAGALQRFTSGVLGCPQPLRSSCQQASRDLHSPPSARRLRPLAHRRWARGSGLNEAALGVHGTPARLT
jgi:putative transposase